jgi:hypothetical protein
VNAVWIRFRAELRTRWKVWLVLAVLAGVAGGLVIAAAAGARRTDSVVDRHVAAYRIPDTAVYGADTEDYARIARLPQVEESSFGVGLDALIRTPADEHVTRAEVWFFASVDGRYSLAHPSPKLLAGRLPDPKRPDEAIADKRALEALGIRLGETVRMRLVTWEALEETQGRVIMQGPETATAGPLAEVRIVGVRAEFFPYEVPPNVTLTPAFYRAYGGRDLAVWTEVLNVQLERGPADIPAFEAGLAGRAIVADAQRMVSAVRGSVGLQAQALWLVAAIGAVGAFVLLGQALARQALAEAVDYSTLGALGMTRRQLVAVGIVRAALIGLGAAALAVAVAAVFSPLLPVGRARELEPSPGFAFDPLAAGVGAGAMLLAVVAAGSLSARRAARVGGARRARSPEGGGRAANARPAELLARFGFPAAVVTGVRLALTRGRGPSAVPVGTPIAGAVLAIAVLGLALTFTSSLAHLFDTPRLYGQNWDYETTYFGYMDVESQVAAIRADPAIEAAALGDRDHVVFVAGRQVGALAVDTVKGSLLPTVIEGRAPRTVDEILLGSKIMDALGLELGDTVEVRASETARMQIVGRTVLAPTVPTALGEGAALTFQALRRIEPDASPYTMLFRLTPGSDREAVLARLEREYVDSPPRAPSEEADFGGVDELPFAVAALFAAVTAAVLAHALVTSIRRRRDLAVLKTLGFDRGQMLATVAWQATTVAAIGLLVGLPIGIGLGRWAWNLFAEDLGVVPEPVTPLWPVLLIVPATILLANLVAALPGRMAARTQPALVLRAE